VLVPSPSRSAPFCDAVRLTVRSCHMGLIILRCPQSAALYVHCWQDTLVQCLQEGNKQ
jgi:hypothetical protein